MGALGLITATHNYTVASYWLASRSSAQPITVPKHCLREGYVSCQPLLPKSY
jgi:hypothetical protein